MNLIDFLSLFSSHFSFFLFRKNKKQKKNNKKERVKTSNFFLPFLRIPAVLISYVIPGNIYPVTEHHTCANNLLGKAIRSGYQSHVACTSFSYFPSSFLVSFLLGKAIRSAYQSCMLLLVSAILCFLLLFWFLFFSGPFLFFLGRQ